MQRICRTLAAAGYRVTLVGRRLPRSPALVEEPYEQHRLRCRYHRGKLFYLEYNWRLYHFLRKHPSAIVNAVDLDTLAAACEAARATGARVVYDAHEYFSETPEVVRRPLVRALWEWVAERYIPKCAAAYTVGEALAAQLQARYALPFGVVRNTAVHRPVAPIERVYPPVVLYQGALNEGRGLPELLRALPAVPNVDCWIVGEGDLSDHLRGLARRLRLTERIKFWGRLPPGELPALTRQAWLGYNLLENRGKSYFYSLSNKTFDYYQAGLPALHPAFPEYRRLAARYGGIRLVPDLSEERIALEINSLLRDEPTYTQLRRDCAAAAGALHWARDAAKLRTIYADLISSSK